MYLGSMFSLDFKVTDGFGLISDLILFKWISKDLPRSLDLQSDYCIDLLGIEFLNSSNLAINFGFKSY